MTNPKYATRIHRQQRAHWAAIVASGQAECAEPICLQEQEGNGRYINPGTPWDVCHAPDGITYIGAGHARCNRTEAARRGNAQRNPRPTTLWWRQ